MSYLQWKDLTFIQLLSWYENNLVFKVSYQNKSYILKTICGLSENEINNFINISKTTLDNRFLYNTTYLKGYGKDNYQKLENVLKDFSLETHTDNVRLCKINNNFIFLLMEDIDNTLSNLKNFSIYIIIELYLFVYTFLVNSLIPVNLNPSNIGTTILKENLNIQLENSENKTVNFIIPKDKISIKIINYGVFNKFARHNYIMHHDVLGKILKVLQYINDNTTDKTIKKLIEYLRNKNTYKLKAIDVLFNIINKMDITSYENNTQNQNIIIKQDNKILSKTQYSNKIECLEEDDIQRLYEEQKIPKSFVKNYNNINNFPYLEISCKLKDVIIKEIIYQWNKLPRSDKLNYIN